MQILNTNEILAAIQPEDKRLFLRWLSAKIEQVLNYPQLLPYEANTRMGYLSITENRTITINNIEVII